MQRRLHLPEAEGALEKTADIAGQALGFAVPLAIPGGAAATATKLAIRAGTRPLVRRGLIEAARVGAASASIAPEGGVFDGGGLSEELSGRAISGAIGAGVGGVVGAIPFGKMFKGSTSKQVGKVVTPVAPTVEETVATSAQSELFPSLAKIDIRKVGVSDDVVDELTKVASQGGAKQKFTMDELNAIADSRGLNRAEFIRGAKPDKDGLVSLDSATSLRSAQIQTQVANQFDDVVKALPDDIASFSEKGATEFIDTYSNYLSVTKALNPFRSATGRSLVAQKVGAQKRKAISALSERLLKTNGKIDITRSWEMLQRFKATDFNNIAEVNKLVRFMEKPKFMDFVYEYWYNSILSGVPTHIVNNVSNTTFAATQTIDKAIRGALDIPISAIQRRPRQFFISEATSSAKAQAKSLSNIVGVTVGSRRGIAKLLEMIKRGTIEGDLSKFTQEVGSSLGAFARSESPVLRGIAPAISLPTTGLRFADMVARTIGYDGEIAALATRKGLQAKLKGKELGKFVMEHINNPTDDMIEGAGKFADRVTFIDAPGTWTNAITTLRDMTWGGRFVVPFVRTIANLMKRGIELTPGVGLIGRDLTGANLSQVASRQLQGTAIMWYFAQKYADGELTGNVPKEKSRREAFYRSGRLPHSVKIGDNWVQYRRIEPFNTVISFVASAGDAYRDNDEVISSDAVKDFASGVAGNLLDASYLNGVSALISGIERGDGATKVVSNAVQQAAFGFIPASSFLRSTARATEAFRQGETVLRNPRSPGGVFQTPFDKARTQLPLLSEGVAPRFNVWGEPIILPGGVARQFLPYKLNKQTTDPVELELQRLKVFPGKPSKKIDDVELSTTDHDRLVVVGGKNAKRSLDEVIASRAYRAIPDTPQGDIIKKKMIRRIIKQSRAIARAEIRRTF